MRLRHALWSLGMLLPLLICHADGNIALGDSREAAVESLGPPIGTIQLREKTVLIFPRGEVELENDTVTRIDLVSLEEHAANLARLEKEREEWQAEQARLREMRQETGEAIRRDKLSSSAFAALRARDRVAFWRNFQTQYPDVDVSEELAKSLESYESELTELKMQERIAELEARVAQAEKEAAQARLEAQRLRDEAAVRERSNRYGLRYYYDGPTYQPQPYYRPPKVTIIHNNSGTHVIQSDGHREKRFRQDLRPGPQPQILPAPGPAQ